MLLSEDLSEDDSTIVTYYKRLNPEHRDYIRGKMVELYMTKDEADAPVIANKATIAPKITHFVPLAHKTEKRYDADGSKAREVMKFNIPAAAGTGQFLDSDDFEMVTVGDDVPLSTSFGVSVSGDSMEPDYPEGSTVWVKRQLEIRNGQVGIFVLNNQAYIKKFRKLKDGVELVSINAKYAPIEINEDDDLRCYGLVLALSK